MRHLVYRSREPYTQPQERRHNSYLSQPKGSARQQLGPRREGSTGSPRAASDACSPSVAPSRPAIGPHERAGTSGRQPQLPSLPYDRRAPRVHNPKDPRTAPTDALSHNSVVGDSVLGLAAVVAGAADIAQADWGQRHRLHAAERAIAGLALWAHRPSSTVIRFEAANKNQPRSGSPRRAAATCSPARTLLVTAPRPWRDRSASSR